MPAPQAPDPLAAALSAADLGFWQLVAIDSAIESGSSMACAVREQSDFESDIWNDMSDVIRECHSAAASVHAVMDEQQRARAAAYIAELAAAR